MEKKHIGAFFDFDRTLIDVESGRIGFKYLYERREISLVFLLKIIAADFFYQRNVISDTQMARIMLKVYKGRNLEAFESEAETFYKNFLKPHLAPNIFAKLIEHQAAGHILILISASIRYLLAPVVEDLGFDRLLCTDLEVGLDGFLTGRAAGPICIGENKKIAAEKLAVQADIHLEKSYAYGNHHSDVPLLEAVGHPTAVEPTLPLKRRAERKGWPIISF
jgi:putative phosphoserine phosphatase/1-acylglycerol-3-phosphate O-acyltransferase